MIPSFTWNGGRFSLHYLNHKTYERKFAPLSDCCSNFALSPSFPRRGHKLICELCRKPFKHNNVGWEEEPMIFLDPNNEDLADFVETYTAHLGEPKSPYECILLGTELVNHIHTCLDEYPKVILGSSL